LLSDLRITDGCISRCSSRYFPGKMVHRQAEQL
jgi:hypothetical protein